MTNKGIIENELTETQTRFLELVSSIPKADYSLPTDNPAWTVGDVLYHITLGQAALAF